VANHLFGSAISAGPDRMTAAGRAGIPQIVASGCYDLLDIVGWHPRPPRFAQHEAHAHNRLISSILLDAGERREVARAFAAKLAQATGPTTLLLPLHGCNEWDRPGAPLSDPGGLAAFLDEVRRTCPPNVRLVEVDAHINDPPFHDAALRVLDEWVTRGLLRA
jgi:uncharacterized protein (UPF0261 family)